MAEIALQALERKGSCVVEHLLDPLMTAASQLLTTGPVVVNDMAQNQTSSS